MPVFVTSKPPVPVENHAGLLSAFLWLGIATKELEVGTEGVEKFSNCKSGAGFVPWLPETKEWAS
jgi:hypothetical protein